MWGWSSDIFKPLVINEVFPMYVGVILHHQHIIIKYQCVPHVCGGDPSIYYFEKLCY